MSSPTNINPDINTLISLVAHQPAIVQHIIGGAARGLYPMDLAVAVADQTERLREQLAQSFTVQVTAINTRSA